MCIASKFRRDYVTVRSLAFFKGVFLCRAIRAYGSDFLVYPKTRASMFGVAITTVPKVITCVAAPRTKRECRDFKTRNHIFKWDNVSTFCHRFCKFVVARCFASEVLSAGSFYDRAVTRRGGVLLRRVSQVATGRLSARYLGRRQVYRCLVVVGPSTSIV